MVGVVTMTFDEVRNMPSGICGVYVCERQGNTVKCGFSNSLRHRIFELRTTGYTSLEKPRVSFITIDMRRKWYLYRSLDYLEVLERRFFKFLPKPCERREVFPCSFEEATDCLKKFASEWCQKDNPDHLWVKYIMQEKK